MKPGDLVFISATYYNEKLKPFPHKMTHVEIFTVIKWFKQIKIYKKK